MFSIAQRDELRDAVLGLAADDERVVDGRLVGSLATGAGDRFSDLDLTFVVAEGVAVGAVLDDWTARLAGSHDAIRLVDLHREPVTYRVLLLPGALQLDLSMAPAGAPAPAPASAPGDLFIGTPAVPEDVLGWGVVYALHARACIERRRVWQAEHYVGAVRDHALALASLTHDLPPAQARRFDDLPGDVLARLADAHVGALDPAALRTALAAGARELLHAGGEAGVETTGVVGERLADLT